MILRLFVSRKPRSRIICSGVELSIGYDGVFVYDVYF